MPKRSAEPAAGADPGEALDFCIRLSRASAVVAQRLERTLSGLHGLGVGDFLVLYHLGRAADGRLRRIDLAHRLELTASGVTRSLLPLERRGLVARGSDPHDARIAFASLTGAGERLLTDALLTAGQVCREVVETVDPAHRPALAAALGRLAGINLANA